MNTKKQDSVNNIKSYVDVDESLIETLPLEVILKNVIITDFEIENNKKLLLTEKEGNMFPNDRKTLKITARGLENGLRKIHDGCSYFGLRKEDSNIVTVNDFVVNYQNNSNSIENINSIFCIYFFRETNKYYLKNLTNSPNFFIYVKIEKKLNFKEKQFLIVGGENFIDLEVQENNSLKVIFGNNLKKSTKIVQNKKQILIGRRNDCDIQFEEACFSRVHITIEFDETTKSWTIQDGHNDSKSMNGTWILKDCYEITNMLTFKIDKSLFEITLE